jgi:hypothetical protein
MGHRPHSCYLSSLRQPAQISANSAVFLQTSDRFAGWTIALVDMVHYDPTGSLTLFALPPMDQRFPGRGRRDDEPVA